LARLIPDILSGARVVLAYPFFRAMGMEGGDAALVAAACFVVAVATDLLDGALARRLGTAGARGRTLDHTADFLFVVAGLLGAASRGALPLSLPIVVSLAFAQYVVDSLLLEGRAQLRMSPLGRWNGVLYFVPAAGDILVRLGIGLLSPAVVALSWALVFTTLASMGERGWRSWNLRQKAPGSRAAGTRHRSPR
jgi:phosphatidylglycerophosphate synthase